MTAIIHKDILPLGVNWWKKSFLKPFFIQSDIVWFEDIPNLLEVVSK